MPENFAVNYLRFKQRGQNDRMFCPKCSNGMAKSEDTDQTAPLGSDLGLHCLSENLGSLQ